QLGYTDPNTPNCVFPKGKPPSPITCGDQDCGGKNHVPSIVISGAATQNVAILLQFSSDSQGVNSLDGVSDGRLSGKSYSLTNYQGPGNTLVFQSGYSPHGNCSGDLIFIKAGSNQATRYTLNKGNN